MSDTDENPTTSEPTVTSALPAETSPTERLSAEPVASESATPAPAPDDASPYAAYAPSAPTAPARPRTRWAAIVWGVIVAAIAGVTLAIVGAPESRLAVSDWLNGLTPGTFWILAALVVGAFIFVVAILSLVRRAQKRTPAPR